MVDEQSIKTAFEAAQATPYLKLLGIELIELGAETAVMSLEMRDDLRQPYGLLHGGATASLIDTAMAFANLSVLAADERATTVDLTVQYLRPHPEQSALRELRCVVGCRQYRLYRLFLRQQKQARWTAI